MSQIFVCRNPKCKPVKLNGVVKAGPGIEKEFKHWTPVGNQLTPACIACNQPMEVVEPPTRVYTEREIINYYRRRR